MEENKNQPRILCQFCGFVKQKEDCSCCISDKNTVKEACLYWRLKLTEIKRVIKLFCDDKLIKCLVSQVEGFIGKLMLMENMLCNANRLQREDMERIVFERVKYEEKCILKSLSYRKYCKIKDLTSMFNKTQPIIAYNTDPRDDYNHWKDKVKEDTTETIRKLCTEHKKTVLNLNNSIANLNSNIDSLISETEIKKNRWKLKKLEYKQLIEELTAQEEKLSRRYKKTKNHKKELLQDIENLTEVNLKLNEEKEKLNGENKNFEQKVKNLNEELTDLKAECKELNDIVNYHSKIANNEENKENEEGNPYDNLKKNINNLKGNLSQKIIENENLKAKLDEIRIAAYNELKELIQGIMDNEDSFKRLLRSLSKFLDESSEYDEEKFFNFINYSAFNYFFNPSIDIQIKVSTHSEGKGKLLKVGFFNKGTNDQIGASMWVFDDGELYQGYFKENEREYYGRNFNSDGNFYEGAYKNSKWHGKGEKQLADGRRLVGNWVDNLCQGPAEFYNKDGNKFNYVYKDGERVKQ